MSLLLTEVWFLTNILDLILRSNVGHLGLKSYQTTNDTILGRQGWRTWTSSCESRRLSEPTCLRHLSDQPSLFVHWVSAEVTLSEQPLATTPVGLRYVTAAARLVHSEIGLRAVSNSTKCKRQQVSI